MIFDTSNQNLKKAQLKKFLESLSVREKVAIFGKNFPKKRPALLRALGKVQGEVLKVQKLKRQIHSLKLHTERLAQVEIYEQALAALPPILRQYAR